MFLRLLLAFTIVPLLELALLIRIGEWLGVWETIGVVVLTGVVGAALARREGVRALGRIQASMNQGILPARELVEGCMILASGLLLVTPGVLTDVVGFALLIPAVRSRVGRYAREAVRRRMTIIDTSSADGFIDVETTSTDNEDTPS
ncbi:MAG: FxsA family protein [Planctomycetes bacterium]|nr:FxsA family protein [Planctomycetota bacterium]